MAIESNENNEQILRDISDLLKQSQVKGVTKEFIREHIIEQERLSEKYARHKDLEFCYMGPHLEPEYDVEIISV